MSIFNAFIKRGIDIIFSLILTVILFPVLLFMAILVKIGSEGHVFFVQERVGRGEKLFNVYKFRTMLPNAEKTGAGYNIEKNDARITKIGKILRRWCMDELPQLFNVLKGDMSLVGPRPTLKYQVDEYTPYQKRRLEVKPGMTGWAQVNGRNLLSWDDRIKLDVYYIDHYSLLFDIKIMLKTFKLLLSSRGVYEDIEK